MPSCLPSFQEVHKLTGMALRRTVRCVLLADDAVRLVFAEESINNNIMVSASHRGIVRRISSAGDSK